MKSLNSLKRFPAKKCTFTVFDIQEFYPSITKDLLKQAILFAQDSVSIPPKSVDVIFHSCKCLLYHNDDPCVKKDASIEFDITMGAMMTPRYAKQLPCLC